MPDSTPPPAPLDYARSIAPLVAAEADESERIGTTTPAVVEAFRKGKLQGFMVPRELGGAGLDMPAAIEVLEEVSRADGSAGWSLMAAALGTSVAAAYAGDKAVQALFGGGKLPVVAGMLAPGGEAHPRPGGYEVAGRFSFASGSGFADWINAGFLTIENDGTPRRLSSGFREVRGCLFPRAAVEMKGGWNVMGLSGTGSYDYEVPKQFVEDDYTWVVSATEPRRGGARFSVGPAGFACLGHTAVVLGIARRAIEELAPIVTGKKRLGYPSVIADHAAFRQDFARHEAAYQGARAFVFKVFEDLESALAAGQPFGNAQLQRLRQSATHTHHVILELVNFCYLWGGSQSLRNPSALGRCMRDMHGATQHIYVDPASLADSTPELLKEWLARANLSTKKK